MEIVEEVLNNHEGLDQWFIDLKKWDKYEVCEMRRVWLEIFGLPRHGRSRENFKNIGELWGSFVCLGQSI